IFAMMAFEGSTVTSSTPPKATKRPSADATTGTFCAPAPSPISSVPSLAPVMLESWSPVTASLAPGGRLFFLRQYLTSCSVLVLSLGADAGVDVHPTAATSAPSISTNLRMDSPPLVGSTETAVITAPPRRRGQGRRARCRRRRRPLHRGPRITVHWKEEI